jgi:hypothetical protein
VSGAIIAHSPLDHTIPYHDSEVLVESLGGSARVKLLEVPGDGEWLGGVLPVIVRIIIITIIDRMSNPLFWQRLHTKPGHTICQNSGRVQGFLRCRGMVGGGV